MRFAWMAALASLLLGAGVQAEAQTPAGAADQSRFYADFTFGPTFGHKSSGSVGGEGGYHLTDRFDVFFEGGHIGNAGTQDLDTRAQLIANAVGATVSTAYKVSYFDFAVRHRWREMSRAKMKLKYRPYVGLGVGFAHVRSETVFSVNGIAVPPDSLGVQIGSDLSGSLNKGFLMLGGGATAPFGKRYFADLSYRYGRVFARTSQIENDVGINTNRLQFGVGIKF